MSGERYLNIPSVLHSKDCAHSSQAAGRCAHRAGSMSKKSEPSTHSEKASPLLALKSINIRTPSHNSIKDAADSRLCSAVAPLPPPQSTCASATVHRASRHDEYVGASSPPQPASTIAANASNFPMPLWCACDRQPQGEREFMWP